MSLLDRLQQARTADDVAHAIASADLDELDARRGRAVRHALERCATEIAGTRELIVTFLAESQRATSVTDIDALALRFQRDVLALTADGGESEDGTETNATARSTGDTLFLAARERIGDTTAWEPLADYLEEGEQAGDAAWLRSADFQALWGTLPAVYAERCSAFDRYRQTLRRLPPGPSLQAVLRSFSLEQWLALRHLQQPRLILIPPVDFERCVTQILDRHPHTSRDYATYVAGLYRDTHPSPKDWQAFFVEGGQSGPEPSDAEGALTLAQRIAAETNARPAHVGGIDRSRYLWLMLSGLEQSPDPTRQIDAGWTWTILDADEAWNASDRSRVPVAYFIPEIRRAGFNWAHSADRYRAGRCRRAVGGDVRLPGADHRKS